MEVAKVLRVGVANNFNFTEKELEFVRALDWPQDKIFVNSNSFVRVNAEYPSFLTVNPYLTGFVEPAGDLSNVRACRIKYVSDGIEKVRTAFNEALEWCLSKQIPVLITFMRFASKTSMERYVQPGGILNYSFEAGYWRLKDVHKRATKDIIKSYIKSNRLNGTEDLVYYCDLAGEGCPVCGNCAKLAFSIGDDPFELFGINLSASGDRGGCMFNCPDCWAKRIQAFRKPVYDKITQNSKQRGHAFKEKVTKISKKLSKNA